MILFLIFFLAVQFAIGYWASKKVKSENDFLLAGRHIPTWLLTFSLFATWFGAETCIGTSGEVFEKGLSGARADPFGYSLCLLLLGFLIAGRIWKKNYSTLSDFYRDRFGAPVEKVATFILLIGSIIWGAAQIRAFGKVVSATTSLSIEVTLLIGLVVVVAYSMLGGLMADIMTDFVQGVTIIVGLAILLIIIVSWEGIHIFQQDPARLSFIATDESLLERLDRWMIPIFGSLVAQESISRILAAQNASQARSATFISSFIYIFVGMIPVILGLIGPALLPDLPDKEHFLIELSQKYLHPVVQMIFAGALISAILSTIDSIMLAGGGLLSHNLLLPFLGIHGQSKKLLYTRLSVLVIAVIAFAIAKYSDGIYQLVETASSLGTAGVLVITVMGLWTAWGGMFSALMTLFSGILTMQLAKEGPAPFLTSVVVSLVTYLLLSFITKK